MTNSLISFLVLIFPTLIYGFTSTPIYTAYTGTPRCYRQPIVTFTTAGTVSPQPPAILAFIEGRNISYCSGTEWPDTVDFPIIVRTSFDGGNSFSAPVEITHGNYDFLVVVTDQSNGRVNLLLQYGDNGIVSLYSDDAGLTWTNPVNVSITNINNYNLNPGINSMTTPAIPDFAMSNMSSSSFSSSYAEF